MEPKANPENPVRFGVFEADLNSGELRKNGVRLRLSGQPFQVLAVLLRNPGNVVTREDLKQELWPDDTFVDFENGVNTAVRKIRRVLDDSADTPRYVETLPRRGYRFIGQVDGLPQDGRFAHSDSQAVRTPSGSLVSSVGVAAVRRYLPWLLFLLTAVASLVLALLYFRQAPPEVPLRRFAITPPVTVRPYSPISPDGRRIALAEDTAQGKLWVQDLAGGEARAIDHTEGARGPFWSSDSQFIGFRSGSDIKKVAVEGGQATRLCGLPSAYYSGGSWAPDGETIVFGAGGVIYEVPALGGIPDTLIKADAPTVSAEGVWGDLQSPHFLPEETGRRILVFTFGAFGPVRNMAVQDLDSGRRELLGPGARPFYSPTGHLVYEPTGSSRTLMALPFSLETLKSTGDAFPIADDGHHPSIAADGSLVYREMPAADPNHLVWIDRGGNRLGNGFAIGRTASDVDLSSDGQQVVVSVQTEKGIDVWAFDLTRDSGSPVTTTVENDYIPAWSPSGEHVAYSSNRTGNADIFLRRSDGTGKEVKLIGTPSHDLLSDWSWDGKYLLFDRVLEQYDLWYIERNQEGRGWGEPQPFLQTRFDERKAKLSPSGRYVAYASNMSGEFQVYVESFPDGGGRVPISRDGGTQPRWSRDSNELFYVQGDALVAVSVKTTPSFSVENSKTLFLHPTLRWHNASPQYDVSNDGQRFILAEPVGEIPKPQIRVVQNWFAEFNSQQQD